MSAYSLTQLPPRQRARRRFTRRCGLAAGIAAMAGASAACHAGMAPSATSGRAGGDAATPIGRPIRGGTLTVATSLDIDTLDPLKYFTSTAGIAFRNLTDTLVRFTQDLQPVPGLARKWDISADGRQYTFFLQPSVKFHDGTDFDAEAVRFTFNRYIRDTTSPWHQDVADVEEITILDPLTVRVTLGHPYAPFLSKLILGAGIIVSPAAVQKLGDTLRRDFTGAGSGPWKFQEWVKDDHFTAVRNENYWDKDATGTQLPYADRLIFKVIPNENTRLAYLKTGEVDALASYMGTGTGPPPQNVAAVKQDPEFVYREEPGLGWTGFYLNVTKPPFDKKEVRQALAYAVDRAQIVRTVNFGVGTAADTVIPPGQLGGDSNYHPYLKQDLAKAKQLLQQAGASAVSFTFKFSPASPLDQQLAELVKDQIAAAGFDMRLEAIEGNVQNAPAIVQGDYQAALTGWSGFVDPDGNVYQLFHTDGGANRFRYSNPALDQLIDKGRQTLDAQARVPIYRQISHILADDSPAVVLYFRANNVATSRRVQHFPLGTASIIRFADAWKTGT